MICSGQDLPFDSKSSDSWLLRQNVASHFLKDWLSWWIGIELFRIVLVVDIVSDSNKLSAIVGTGEEDDGNAEDLSIWDALGVRWVGFEDKLVDSDWDGTDEEGVELLIVLIAGSC